MFVSDIDGVLCESADLAVQYACHQLDLRPQDLLDIPNDDYDNGLIDRFPVELREAANRLIRAAFDENKGDIYRIAPVRTQSHEALHELAGAGLLRGYVTRRPPIPEVIAATRDWILENRFPNLPIEHVPRGISKAVHMQRLDARIIVEDSPQEAESVLAHGLDVIYMDHPYNRHVEHPHLRINCWSGILPLVRMLRRQAA